MGNGTLNQAVILPTYRTLFPSSVHEPVVPPLLSPTLTHVCSVLLMKRKVMVPPKLIRRTEMQSADRLVIRVRRETPTPTA